MPKSDQWGSLTPMHHPSPCCTHAHTIITPLLCQNDIETSFWRNNGAIIAPCVRWGCVTLWYMLYWTVLWRRSTVLLTQVIVSHYIFATANIWDTVTKGNICAILKSQMIGNKTAKDVEHGIVFRINGPLWGESLMDSPHKGPAMRCLKLYSLFAWSNANTLNSLRVSWRRLYVTEHDHYEEPRLRLWNTAAQNV